MYIEIYKVYVVMFIYRQSNNLLTYSLTLSFSFSLTTLNKLM